jgi:hypothetical protein
MGCHNGGAHRWRDDFIRDGGVIDGDNRGLSGSMR